MHHPKTYVTELQIVKAATRKAGMDTKAGKESLFALVSSKGFSEEMPFELNTE